MVKRAKQERRQRKQKKERQRREKRRVAILQARTEMNPPKSVEPGSGADDEKNAGERASVEDATVSTDAVRTLPASDSQTEVLIDRWWDDFDAADVDGKIYRFLEHYWYPK